jgi:PilZ domain
MAKLPKVVSRMLSWLEEPGESEPCRPPTFLEQLARGQASDKEQRVSPRKSVRLVAEILQGSPFTVVVENLSKHGLYFISDSTFATGSTVELTMELPNDIDGDNRCVHLLVRIVRVHKASDGRFGVAAQMMRCRTILQPSPEAPIGQISR